ncbi:hypothetical protein [Streptococcus sp. A22]|uniref:hypothetical protein n=1 Tax=Streptococcus sp. A22 TaxID=3373126 RepID=UPI00374DF983
MNEAIIQYESNHASHDLSAFKELLASTKALLAEYSNRPRTVATYQSGNIGRLTNIERFATAYEAVANHLSNNAERLQDAQERDRARFEALAAEERSKQGWIDLALGAVTIAVGLAAIVATAGAATPLVVGAGIVAGTGTVAYGASNVAEAGQDIYLGYKGDGKTLAINPIRDILFMGNDKLYHQVGGLFTTTSAVMIPIGQTQSVTKGLAEFAIGEVGGFVGGQAGYHGTKLLGGSEADAERATFVGSILGGFAASSAASKFSLNDIGETKATSFIEQMSPEDAQRYVAWNEFVEAGIEPEARIRILDEGIISPHTYQEFIKHNPFQNVDDYLELVKGQSPWPKGFIPEKRVLKGGDMFEMALSPGQEDFQPGGFATDVGTITDVNYVRNKLAVKVDWKGDIDRVVVYKVKDGLELPVQVGPVGPQIDLKVDKYLPGGAGQKEFLLPREIDRMDYLDVIEELGREIY